MVTVIGLVGLQHIIILPAALAATGPGTFQVVQSLGTPRTGHTATKLDGPACRTSAPAPYCGKVLVVGGRHDRGDGHTEALASTELYDTASRSWAPAAPMFQARSRHSATLLDAAPCKTGAPPTWCGKVLVVGGAGQEGTLVDGAARVRVLSSAELYDPVTATWTSAGDFGTDPRAAHTATQLASGKVVIAGGARGDPGQAMASVKIFDPETTRWRDVASMAKMRAGHTATYLPANNKILVRGGVSFNDSSELYDPDANLWSATPVANALVEHTATLLSDNETVLIVGGLAGQTGSQAVGAELYLGATNTWIATSSPQTPRSRHTATLLPDGEVFITGGTSDALTYLANSEIYDPATTLWRPGGSLVNGRVDQTASLLGDNAVMVAGGSTSPSLNRAPHREDLPQRMLASTEILNLTSSVKPPSITSIDPASGPSAGGSVRVMGAGLDGANRVTFGGVQATTFTVDSPSQITVSYPPGTQGAVVDVEVTNPQGGASVKTESTRFAYGEPTRYWVPTGDLSLARGRHTATVLSEPSCRTTLAPNFCGKVLIVRTDPETQGGRYGAEGQQRNQSHVQLDLYDPMSATFSLVGGRRGGFRGGHTATMLDQGLLITGGDVSSWTRVYGGGNTVSVQTGGAETYVYDPLLGAPSDIRAWRESGPLLTPRAAHSATLLPGGKVLAVGGVAPSQEDVYHFPTLRGNAPVATAEVYDPSAATTTTVDRDTGQFQEEVQGAWAATGSMMTARSEHTATPLGNGRVLVVGGTGQGGEALSSAEIYDSAKGTWSPAGHLATARTRHTATMLTDGRVLVVGGSDSRGHSLDSAEIYDPAAGAWAQGGEVAVGRSAHTATVVGGGKVVIAGGIGNDGRTVEVCELFDPATGTWTPTASLGTPRSGHTATLLDKSGELLVTGGLARQGDAAAETTSAELLKFSAPPTVAGVNPPAGPTFGGTAVTITGTHFADPVLSVRFGNVPATQVTRVSDEEVRASSPPQAQGDVAVTVTTAVGTTGASLQSGNGFRYAPGAWHPAEALHEGRSDHTATVLTNGKVLVAGGSESSFSDSQVVATSVAELYDPDSGTWTPTGPMTTPRFSHTATLLADGEVLVAGGDAGPKNSGGTPVQVSAEIYNPTTGTWRPTGPLNVGRFSHTATLLDSVACRGTAPPGYCGKVLVTGGTYDRLHSVPLASAELYDPTTGLWTVTQPLDRCAPASCSARVFHTATLLKDGRVLLVGGAKPSPDMAGTAGCTALTVLGPGCILTGLATSQIYDAQSGSWLQAGGLGVARYGHTATVLDQAPCGANCGKVLVAGGQTSIDQFVTAAEVFDPDSRQWAPAESMATARGGHTATLLANGTVLVAGAAQIIAEERALPVPPLAARASAEVFSPITGLWTVTDGMGQGRGIQTASPLGGPRCAGPNPPGYCGGVLVAGGVPTFSGIDQFVPKDSLNTSEIYSPAPDITAVVPVHGPVRGAPTTATGTGLAGASKVTFGGAAASSFSVDSPTHVSAGAPSHPRGTVELAIEGPGGTSAHLTPQPEDSYVFVAAAGVVGDLVAAGTSPSTIRLDFSAVDDGTGNDLATEYVIKQSTEPITDSNFDSTTSICRGACTFAAAIRLHLEVGGLAPGTAYYYAAKARSLDGDLGSISNVAAATTAGLPLTVGCPVLPAPSTGQALYPAGYSLVGVPSGTALGALALYGWENKGAGADYSPVGSDAMKSGLGYWAYYSCPRLVSLSSEGSAVDLPLQAYHASMVGNPSPSLPAQLSGQDFSARWDPAGNGGAGSYVISGYQEAKSLAVGEGAWAFSYRDTVLGIAPVGG